MIEWVNAPNGVYRKGAMQGCLCTEQWQEMPPGECDDEFPRYAYALLVDIECQHHGRGWTFVVTDGCPRWERVPDELD